MFAVVGATGKTGSAAVASLHAAGKPVRALVRKSEQVDAFKVQGVQAVMASVGDVDSLQRAFDGCEAAYLMNPPDYASADMFAEAHAIHANLLRAASAAGLSHIVALSSTGAQYSSGTGNILTTHDFESQLADFKGSVTLLRAANFMENWASSIPAALKGGVLPSMFLPLDRAIPMIAAKDVGTTAAQLLMNGPALPVYSLESEFPVSPNQTAAVLTRILDKPVIAVAVDESEFAQVFLSKGLSPRTAEAFSEMFKGFNSGHIRFEGTEGQLHGNTTLEQSMIALLGSQS